MTNDSDNKEIVNTIDSRILVQCVRDYAIISLNMNGTITNWNDGARELFGYSEGEIVGKNFSTLFKREDAALEQCQREFSHALIEERFQVEGWRVRKDGGVFWAQTSFSRIFDSSRGVIGLAVVMGDLTEKRKRELDLLNAIRSYNAEKKKNDLFMQALDESSVIAYTDIHGNFIGVNDRFCAASGYERDDLIGRNTRIMNSGFHTKEFFRQMWDKILRGEIWTGEICNKKKDGTLFWVYGPIVPIFDEGGKVEKFFTIRQNVTEKKNLENQLWISQKLLQDGLEWRRNILDSSNQCIIATDSRGTILIFNKAAEKMFGYTFQEISGLSNPTIFFNSEEIKLQAMRLSDRFQKRIDPNLETLVTLAKHTGEVDESEWILYKKDRTIFPAKVGVTALINQKRECTGYLFVIQDISVEKNLKQQLVELKESLMQKTGIKNE